jgi:hypothetical protein
MAGRLTNLRQHRNVIPERDHFDPKTLFTDPGAEIPDLRAFARTIDT